MSIRGWHLLVAPAAVLIILLVAAPASAAFSSKPTTNQSATTSKRLQPASGLTGACNTSGLATLNWVGSSSNFETGYTLSWTGTPAGSQTLGNVLTTTASLTKGNPYTFTLKATFKNWTSTAVTLSITC